MWESLDAQILAYRRLSGEDRLRIALDLHELACEIARAGIRARYPDAQMSEVEDRLRERIRLAYGPPAPPSGPAPR